MMVAWLLLEGGEKKKKKEKKYVQLFQIAALQRSPLALTAAGMKQPYCYHFKHTSCEGLRDLLSKSKKKCAALWSMSLVSTLMRLPMPANLKIKMAE